MNSHKQHGAALITVMIMVTVVIAVLASMFHEHGVDVAKSTKILHSERAALLALSGESLAIDMLKRDEREQAGVDTLDDIWALQLPAIPLEEANLLVTLSDLQSKWNINNLQRYKPATINAIRAASTGNSDLSILERLGATQDTLIDQSHIAAIIDWLDSDDIPLPSGGEENEYLLEEPAYRPSNTLLTGLDELSLILALSPELRATISPFITALPEPTPINVNTASKEVLQSLHADINEAIAENLIETRTETPWQTMGEFSDALDIELNPINPGDVLSQINTQPASANIPGFTPVSINSRYFMLNIAVQLGTNMVELESLIRRNNATDVVVLARTLRYVANTLANTEADE